MLKKKNLVYFAALALGASLLLSSCGASPVLNETQKTTLQKAVSFEDQDPVKNVISGPIHLNVTKEVLDVLKTVSAKYDRLDIYKTSTASKSATSVATYAIAGLKEGMNSTGKIPANTRYDEGDTLVLYFANSKEPTKENENPYNTTVSYVLKDMYKGAVQDVAPLANAVQLANVQFDYDKSEVSADARAQLKKELEGLNLADAKAVVAGFCDERGTVEYNLALGERRANAVKRVLVSEGLKSGNVRTISYGKDRPLDRAHTEEAWAKNRRAETQLSAAKK